MACSAASPRLPSAARWNISSVSRRQRATLALKSSFFVPKSRKRYGCETPARRAMSSVEVPAQPRSANSICAASRMASRRSAAESRVAVGLIAGRLVMTHKFVKPLRDAVELGLGETRVKRQGERALVDRVGSRKRPLVAEGAEPVQRVSADLALDPLCPQFLHHLVAPVDLAHVRLPAVAVPPRR